MVVALLRFSQPGRVGEAGHALIVTAGTTVTIHNSDNTDVGSWRLELLHGPVGSAFETDPGVPILLAQNAADDTPEATPTPTPGAPGSYRVLLTVWEGASYTGAQDIDIRCFTVLTPNLSAVLPPYQRLPDPRPLLGTGVSGEKPDELNFEGQPWGWSGPNYAHATYGQDFEQFRLLNAALLALDGALIEVPSLGQVLLAGTNAGGAPILSVGSSDTAGAYETNGNISISDSITALADTLSFSLAVPQPAEDITFQRIHWLVTVTSGGDSWGFDWLSQTQWTAPNTGVLRLSKAVVRSEDMEGTPPDVSLSASVIAGETILTVTNNSGGIIDVRIGADSIQEREVS